MIKFGFRASMLSVLACSALQASAGVQIQKMFKDIKMPSTPSAAIAAAGVCTGVALVYKAVQNYKQDQAMQRYWSAIENNNPEALRKVLTEGFDFRTFEKSRYLSQPVFNFFAFVAENSYSSAAFCTGCMRGEALQLHSIKQPQPGNVSHGEAGLFHAILKGYSEVARILIKAGVKSYYTFLHAMNHDDQEMMEKLSFGLDEQEKNNALTIAVHAGNKVAIQFLMEIRVFFTSDHLRRAVDHGNAEIVAKILKHGITAFDTGIIMSAARHESDEILKMILGQFESKLNIDFASHAGNTALMNVVLQGNIVAAKNLIKNGANINATNFYGKTAADYACHDEIRDLLIAKKAEQEAEKLALVA